MVACEDERFCLCTHTHTHRDQSCPVQGLLGLVRYKAKVVLFRGCMVMSDRCPNLLMCTKSVQLWCKALALQQDRAGGPFNRTQTPGGRAL